MEGNSDSSARKTREERLSYKFQRLREKIRQAIVSGELTGKLPGERALAKRFHANAKTLSKALTDLAAEGLLERSIGRGTFVKGSAPEPSADGKWLLLCAPGEESSPVVRKILNRNPQAQVVIELDGVRPSFLNQFQAVILMSNSIPESIVRDLVVRNIPVIAAGSEPRTYSMHTVLIDRALGASVLARDLFLAGHRRVAAIEPRGSTTIADTLRKTAARFAPDAAVDVGTAEEVGALIAEGVTGLVCDSARAAHRVIEILTRLNVQVPGQVSVSAVGLIEDGTAAPCTGYFVTASQKADTIVQVLRESMQRRPMALWLTGVCTEGGTIQPLSGAGEGQHQPLPLPRMEAVAV
jgi:hypothetical protein